MSKLDELKALMALMASHKENPDFNYRRYIFKEALYDNASALIAAVEALSQIDDMLAGLLSTTQVYGSLPVTQQCRSIARAALAPFGGNDEQKP